MGNTFIFETITNYIKEDVYPFHMPGHKRQKQFFDNFDFLDYDLTEFGELDNLHKPQGIILNSEQRAAEVFGAKKSFFLTNGSSSGILIAIMAICNENDKIIVARNSHKSVYNALVLSGADPIYVYPMETDEGLVGSIDPKDIEDAVINNSNIKAIVLTNETYEGFCSDIKQISEIANKHNIILIVDEAHGAHLNFSDFFPQSATKYADIVVQSLHKTLPVLGQSSILHINDKIDATKISFYRSIFNTTSPSYIMMSVMDYSINILNKQKQIFDKYIENLIKCRESLKNCKNIKLIDEDILKQHKVFDIDKSRLTFVINNSNYSGFEIERLLSDKYKIQIELSAQNHFVALSSVCDTKEGFLKLSNAIQALDDLLYTKQNKIKEPTNKNFLNYKTKMAFTPKQAQNKKKTCKQFKYAAGKISAEFIVPYPPGIPLIVPGEIIEEQNIEDLLNFLNNGGKIIGANAERLEYIEII